MEIGYTSTGYASPGGPAPAWERPIVVEIPNPVVRAFSFVDADADSNGYNWTRSALAYTSGLNKQFEDRPKNLWHWFGNSIVTKKATCFSGEMRKVVQLLGGMNAEILYEYTWPTTHGIFVNRETNKRWVIEIAATGITAWLLPICAGGYNDDVRKRILGNKDVLPYLPRPETVLPGGDERRTLAGDVGLAYTGYVLSGEIGWAFSEDGHEAANVIFRGGYGTGEAYEKSFLYKVTFSADGNGDPSSYTLTEESSGWAWTPWLDCNVRVPMYVDCGPAHVRRQFRWRETAERPDEGEISFPIHAFYVGNILKAYTYFLGVTETESIAARDYPAPYIDVGIPGLGGSTGVSRDLNASGEYWTDGHLITTVDIAIKCDPVNLTSGTKIWDTGSELLVHTIEPGSTAVGFVFDNSTKDCFQIWTSHALLHLDAYSNADRYNNYSFSFIIPFFDREGIILYERDQETIEYSSHKYAVAVGGGPGKITIWLHAADGLGLWCSDTGITGDLLVAPTDAYYPDCDLADPVEETMDTYEAVYGSPGSLVSCGSSLTRYICPSMSTCNETTGPRRHLWYTWYSDSPEVPASYYVGAATTEVSEETTGEVWVRTGNMLIDHQLEMSENEDEWLVFNPDGIYDDNDSCLASSPWWMGFWMDGFNTGRGWVSPDPYACVDNPHAKRTIGNLMEWSSMVNNLPSAGNVQSGWFGCPFPEAL